VIVSPQWPIYLVGMYGIGKLSLFIFILDGVITVSQIVIHIRSDRACSWKTIRR
jgi:hypothetical protein